MRGLGAAPPVNVAAVEENKAMQQSVARLVKEVTTLKANLDEASKAARAQVTKLETKLDTKIDSKIAKLDERLKKEADEVTGSISARSRDSRVNCAMSPAASGADSMRSMRCSKVAGAAAVAVACATGAAGAVVDAPAAAGESPAGAAAPSGVGSIDPCAAVASARIAQAPENRMRAGWCIR